MPCQIHARMFKPSAALEHNISTAGHQRQNSCSCCSSPTSNNSMITFEPSVHTCPPGRSPSSVMLNVCRLPTHPLAKASSCFVLAAAPAKRKTAGAVIDIGRCVGKARVRLPQLASAAGCHCQSVKCPPGEGPGVPFAALRRPSQDRQLEYLE